MRLKGGDPSIFARLTEELAALHAAEVPYEIVPGITAAQAAGSYAGIPLTNRDEASCVAFVTGQESADKEAGTALDYAALAQFPGTLVFYMGVTTAPEWSRALVAHGKSPHTPVAIVRRCTLSDQQTIFTTLAEIGEHLGHGKLRPPAVVIVGDVAAAKNEVNWFTSRPLFGRTILVTRPEHQIESLATQLRLLGADVLVQPAIEISEPSDWSRSTLRLTGSSISIGSCFRVAMACTTSCERLIAPGFDSRDWRMPLGRDRPGHRCRTCRVPSHGRRPARILPRRSIGRRHSRLTRKTSDSCWPAPAAAAKCSPKCSPPPEAK